MIIMVKTIYGAGGGGGGGGRRRRRVRHETLLYLGKIAKMLLDEANDFSCATTDVLAFKMLYLTSFF
jgi:hypothetical protein